MEIKQKVRAFIENNMTVFDDDVTFTDSDNIFEMGFVNSLFAMKLLTFIEQEFSITINNDEMEISNFNSINNIEKLIHSKLESSVKL